jgi:SAM-dependent methyltransferase
MTAFTKNTASRNVFEAKVSRYANAMAQVPYARIMEMIWLSWFLPTNRHAMLDIMGGTGFISGLAGPLFEKTAVIDSIGEYLPPNSSCSVSIAGDVTQKENFLSLEGQINLAISLGGFHHIASSDQVTERIIKTWSNVLKPNGRLIIADVPFQGQHEDHMEVMGDSRNEIPEVTNAISQWHLPKAIGTFSEWSNSLKSVIKDILPKEPEPADFFDNVVAAKCPNGHEANFQNTGTLQNIFSNVGLHNVSAFTIPTPWLFNDRRQAAWFIHELFAFGDQAYDKPVIFPHEKVDEVLESIEASLGVVDLDNGSCITGWKLMIVMGDHA